MVTVYCASLPYSQFSYSPTSLRYCKIKLQIESRPQRRRPLRVVDDSNRGSATWVSLFIICPLSFSLYMAEHNTFHMQIFWLSVLHWFWSFHGWATRTICAWPSPSKWKAIPLCCLHFCSCQIYFVKPSRLKRPDVFLSVYRTGVCKVSAGAWLLPNGVISVKQPTYIFVLKFSFSSWYIILWQCKFRYPLDVVDGNNPI